MLNVLFSPLDLRLKFEYFVDDGTRRPDEIGKSGLLRVMSSAETNPVCSEC